MSPIHEADSGPASDSGANARTSTLDTCLHRHSADGPVEQRPQQTGAQPCSPEAEAPPDEVKSNIASQTIQRLREQIKHLCACFPEDVGHASGDAALEGSPVESQGIHRAPYRSEPGPDIEMQRMTARPLERHPVAFGAPGSESSSSRRSAHGETASAFRHPRPVRQHSRTGLPRGVDPFSFEDLQERRWRDFRVERESLAEREGPAALIEDDDDRDAHEYIIKLKKDATAQEAARKAVSHQSPEDDADTTQGVSSTGPKPPTRLARSKSVSWKSRNETRDYDRKKKATKLRVVRLERMRPPAPAAEDHLDPGSGGSAGAVRAGGNTSTVAGESSASGIPTEGASSVSTGEGDTVEEAGPAGP